MSTQKALTNLARSRVASHAAVTRRGPYNQVLFLYDRRTMPSISQTAKQAEFPSPGTALPHMAWDDFGSARIEVRATLDGERLLIRGATAWFAARDA